MDENAPSAETQPGWCAPWRWHRGVWLAALLMFPPSYLLSLIIVGNWAERELQNTWCYTAVRIAYFPLFDLRISCRRYATRNSSAFTPSNCEVCGEAANFRFVEPAVRDDTSAVRLRSFCDQHHREYLDSPADALKPETLMPDTAR